MPQEDDHDEDRDFVNRNGRGNFPAKNKVEVFGSIPKVTNMKHRSRFLNLSINLPV